jgi:catechol 2,3-dioxygenase-like lactoylglutathione lyase family enzyme
MKAEAPDLFTLAVHGLARMSHVSLEVADLDRALVFYRAHFGLQTVLERRLEGPDFEAVTGVAGARSQMVRGLIAGNAVVQLFWHSWRTPAMENRTLMPFEVRDAAGAYAALAQAGVPSQSEPVAFDNSTAFVVFDPDGHPIEIIAWRPEASPYRVPDPG